MAKKIGLSEGLGKFREEIVVLDINDELKSFIPPLTKDEFKLLEDSISKEGVKEAIDIWLNDDKKYIIDGHNRYQIAKAGSFPFKTKEHKFGSIEEVKEWMLKKQLGRRNLSDANRTYLIGLLYNNSKEEKGGYKERVEKVKVADIDKEIDKLENPSDKTFVDKKDKGQNLPLDEKKSKSTAKKIAEKTGMSEKSVKNAGTFAKGIDKLTSDLKTDVLSGKEKVKKSEIEKLGRLDDVKEKSIDKKEKLVDVVAKVQENDVKPEVKKKEKSLIEIETSLIKLKETTSEDTFLAALNSVLEGTSSKQQVDLIKLVNKGFKCVRRDDTPNIRIKFIDKDNHNWKTEKTFDTKTERDSYFAEILKDEFIIRG